MLHNAKISLLCLLTCSSVCTFSQRTNAKELIAYQAPAADLLASTNTGKTNPVSKDGPLRKSISDSSKAASAKQQLVSAGTPAKTNYLIPPNTNQGSLTLQNNSINGSNSATGFAALQNNTTGIDNTAAGYMALQNNTEGIGNTAIGVYSLQKNTTGLNNTANGSYALSNNTSGERNTALGSLTLTNNISGSANTAIGYQSLLGSTSGSNNTAIGHNAMAFAITGNGNTAIGTSSLLKNFDGNNNTAVGINTLDNNLAGSNNVSTGVRALGKNTNGNNNTAIGFESLSNNVSGNYNTVLGYTADITADGISNATALGSGAKANASNTIQLGNAAVTTVNTNGSLHAAGLALNADFRLRKNIQPVDNGLYTILQLNPVQYEKRATMDAVAYSTTENGFIAQEIQKVLPFIVTEGKDKDRLLSIDYISLIPILTKAMQEQQKQIKQQADDIETLKKLVSKLLEKK